MTNKRSGVSYTLVQCGTPAPANADNSTNLRSVPVTKVAAMETTAVPYLEVIYRKKNSHDLYTLTQEIVTRCG